MKIHQIWKDIQARKNLDLYLTLVVAAAILVADLLGLNTQQIIFNVLLALLGLLAFGMLEDRRVRERIAEAIEEGPFHHHQFFHEWDDRPFRARVKNARTLDLLAIANYVFLSQNSQSLKSLIARGGKIRCVLIDPRSEALVAATRLAVGYEKDPKYLTAQIELALQELAVLAQNADDLQQVQVRLVPILPFAIVTSVDADTDNGEMYITLNGFEQQPSSRPSFILSRAKEPKWFRFFQDSFERVWEMEEARPVNLLDKS